MRIIKSTLTDQSNDQISVLFTCFPCTADNALQLDLLLKIRIDASYSVAGIGYSKGKIQLAQAQLNGVTRIMAGIMSGIMSAIGNIFNLNIRKPVASIKNPPQALKSKIISGVVKGKINLASKNKRNKRINCGIAITETTYPTLQAKIAAVKKSKIDLEIKIVLSPVIPASKLP